MGLLELKAFLKSNSADNADYDLLPSWVDDDRESSTTDCCGWERVTCNATTGHVMGLSLNNTKQLSETQFSIENSYDTFWYLNVSLFQPFKELRSLNLSYNLFSGCIKEDEGFEKLSILRKLETLDLGFNKFNKSILPSLSTLTSLKTLSICHNQLEAYFPAPDEESFSRLKRLEVLDLSGCGFNKSIIKSLGVFPSLKNLILNYNKLEGPFPAQELSVLENLE